MKMLKFLLQIPFYNLNNFINKFIIKTDKGYSVVKLNDISDENKEYFIKELKKRNVVSNLKSRNIKQFLKKIYMNLYINTH